MCTNKPTDNSILTSYDAAYFAHHVWQLVQLRTIQLYDCTIAWCLSDLPALCRDPSSAVCKSLERGEKSGRELILYRQSRKQTPHADENNINIHNPLSACWRDLQAAFKFAVSRTLAPAWAIRRLVVQNELKQWNAITELSPHLPQVLYNFVCCQGLWYFQLKSRLGPGDHRKYQI